MLSDENLPIKRCAIYTRKSTTHRLEHDVNSLVTQREISSAYITSQQYKGWVELPQHYDDGGHSGSGLERPALARLMQDIEAGKIDTVVVYKIDRLTRSLFDFVRLIEMFDRQSITLVSISQAFDTSDSMGRMILNVLLTFSQFERELIAERTVAGLASARARGRKGGRPFKMTAAKLRLAMAAMGQPETKVGDLCQELGVTRQTLYRHVSPKGELRPDGEKLLSRI